MVNSIIDMCFDSKTERGNSLIGVRLTLIGGGLGGDMQRDDLFVS